MRKMQIHCAGCGVIYPLDHELLENIEHLKIKDSCQGCGGHELRVEIIFTKETTA